MSNPEQAGGKNDRTPPAEIAKIVITIVLVAIAVFYVDKRRGGAKPVVIERELNHDSRLIDGELDYGLLYTAKIANQSDKGGRVEIDVHVTTSEGEWDRHQTLVFGPNETKDVEYFISEPTINASNIQGEIKVGKPWF